MENFQASDRGADTIGIEVRKDDDERTIVFATTEFAETFVCNLSHSDAIRLRDWMIAALSSQ